MHAHLTCKLLINVMKNGSVSLFCYRHFCFQFDAIQLGIFSGSLPMRNFNNSSRFNPIYTFSPFISDCPSVRGNAV